MSEPRYHVRNTLHGWSVVRSTPYMPGVEGAEASNSHLGLAETLSEAVLIANEDAGRDLTFKWADDFGSGEGQ